MFLIHQKMNTCDILDPDASTRDVAPCVLDPGSNVHSPTKCNILVYLPGKWNGVPESGRVSFMYIYIYGQVQDTRRPFALAFSLMTANRDGLDVLYYTIRLICQTLVYGESLNKRLRKISLIHIVWTRHVHDTHAPFLPCNVVCALMPSGTRYSCNEQ